MAQKKGEKKLNIPQKKRNRLNDLQNVIYLFTMLNGKATYFIMVKDRNHSMSFA